MDRFEAQIEIRKLFEENLSEEEIKKRMIEIYTEYAKSQGIKLNENKEIVDAILVGLLKKREKYGETYCPCRIVSRNKEEDKNKICPCFWHLDEIKNMNHCLCNLFVKGEK